MGNLLSVHPAPKDVDNSAPKKNSTYLSLAALFCDALQSVFISLFYDANRPTNYYMSGNYAPVDEFGPQTALSVNGELPTCLNGEFVRVGPNPRFKPAGNYHWFDGDGMLHGLRIKDGKVIYVSRYVKTARWKQEEFWGSAQFMKVVSLPPIKALSPFRRLAFHQRLSAENRVFDQKHMKPLAKYSS